MRKGVSRYDWRNTKIVPGDNKKKKVVLGFRGIAPERD
jgi:hypothetical protein